MADRDDDQLISEAGLAGRQQAFAFLAAIAVGLPTTAWGWALESALLMILGLLLAGGVIAWATMLTIRLTSDTEGLRFHAGFWASESLSWSGIRQIRTGGRIGLAGVLGRRSADGVTCYTVHGPTLRILTDAREHVISVHDPDQAMAALSSLWPGEHTVETHHPQQRS